MKKLFNSKVMGIGLIGFCLAGLILIKDVTSDPRAALLVALFGPTGALWFTRLLCVMFIAFFAWVIWHDVKFGKRVDALVRRRYSIDTAVRRDE
ncbi:MAG: hypothetical protein EOP14_03050 [Pseudomonas sp.]|nr:MAG: hypothetical protein EOP14_03050 [Pseudomonas sp.]